MEKEDLTFKEKFFIAAFIEQFKNLEIKTDDFKSIERISVLVNREQLEALKKFNRIVQTDLKNLGL
jgi:hypothetical protein